jgi:nucleotide-binding universal stress UspA family protein
MIMPSNLGIEKILFATDGSASSESAEKLVAYLAKKLGAKVTAIYVASHELMHPELHRFAPDAHEYIIPRQYGQDVSIVTTVHAPKPGYDYPNKEKYPSNDISTWYHEKGLEVLRQTIDYFKEQGVQADEKFLLHVDPASAIVKEAENGNYDLIAIGRSGERGEKPHLGSIAGKVSNHAKIPVLVVGDNKGQVSKILSPVDGSRNAENAAKYAGMLAQNLGAAMTLIYVQEPRFFDPKPELGSKVGKSILTEAAAQAKGPKLDEKLEIGDPAEKIIEAALDGGYDLIVMGGRGHNALTHYLVGSVSDHILHYSNHSVLLVK